MKMKFLICIAVLTTAILCSPGFVSAQVDNSALIVQLQAQIAALQAQLQTLLAQQSTVPATWCYTFNTNLGFANSGSDDVGSLHSALSKEGFSSGSDNIATYGEDTAAEVVQFQAKYGISQTGYVGAVTRAKLNSLYGCINNNPITSVVSNLITPLTSNGTVASASSEYDNLPYYKAYKAFDGQNVYDSTAEAWVSTRATSKEPLSSNPAWLEYNFGVGNSQIINTYTIINRNWTEPTSPNTWSFQGSNDGTTWVDLDSISGDINNTQAAVRTFNFTNDTAYQYYRIYIKASNSKNNVYNYIVAIGELQMNAPVNGVCGSANGSFVSTTKPLTA
ncbi:MAG: peptidoglycan-binding protein, partial [Candidatus Staskawiczbacteria bacterium]|nr:peptidoglycan-binding protein [Candidatus Staskawiczbacteria bacterium]